jgi:Family of unknown function (DUF5995)
MRLVMLAIGLAVTAAATAGAATAAEPVNVNWPSYLPALPGPTKPQPGSVPYCKKPSSRCVDTEVQRLRALQKRLGCYHRAVFATTYLELTKVFRRTIKGDSHFFQFPRYLYTEDALFADVYFNTVKAAERGRPVPPAWQIAFDTARSGEVNAGQDMLLGINAHVQNDMPFVVAALGTHAPNGASRKPDHDRVNKILNAAYQQVVDAVSNRYDPLLKTTNASWNPLDDYGGIEVVKEWRENVWRNAERLLNAHTKAERDQVASQIQQNAATWARLMAAPQQPGYRASRDAYCHAKLAKGA